MRYPDIAEVVKNGHEIIAFRTQTPRALYKMYFYEDLYYQVDSGDNELVAVYGKEFNMIDLGERTKKGAEEFR